ncbi:MAG: family 20 glycosylhydrolase [Pyrinomonadaceae bacterium MAG19_C2-C3]|nr:family 20 glycosylhydrolase [Pyrinomonadaceae bacterium MAG19_C2-C3]
MKIRFVTLFVMLLLSACATGAQTPSAPPAPRHNLMPVPASVRFNEGRMAVTKNFTVATRGFVDERLRSYINRVARRLERRTVMEFPRNPATDASTASLVVACQAAGKTVPALDEDEAYTLEVSERQAVLSARTVVGAMRGLETFLQLVDSDREGYFIPAVSIEDKPRFPWRGLLIDVGRHFHPVEVIKRNLDAMASVKLNVLHWHLTEDQGFRIESKKFPKLHGMGSDGDYYTQNQIREIVLYAQERGIRVVPEFDMPGHATSWLVGYPELGSAPGPYLIERQAGIFNPSLDPTREQVYKFLDTFLGEMAKLFPDAYMHIGGDENTGRQWRLNPTIQAFMQKKGIKDKHALQTYFNQRLLKILKKHGKTMMGWDEILQPDLPKDIVIQSWRGNKALTEAARQGYNGILSNGYYIDLAQSASMHYLVDPLPADTTLTATEAAHILGGEATMWSEWVTPETIDSRIWSRTAAIAERFWSPRTVRDVEDMYRRLAVVDVQLEELGLTHRKNQEMMLRRLAQGANVAALQTLISIVEPVEEYKRFKYHTQHTMLNPLTGLADAARPDSFAAGDFARLVDTLLADAPRFDANAYRIQNTLTLWRDSAIELQPMMDSIPGLHEARPLAKDLSEMATVGLEALSYLSKNIAPAPEWRAAKLAMLEETAKPKAALEFPVILNVRQLVVAACEAPRLKTMTQSAWREHVKQLATPPVPPTVK